MEARELNFILVLERTLVEYRKQILLLVEEHKHTTHHGFEITETDSKYGCNRCLPIIDLITHTNFYMQDSYESKQEKQRL